MRHELKCKEKYFKAIWNGDKTFEIRKNDRYFEERDEVLLQETDSFDECTGREVEGFITYLTDYEQQKGYVVFAFREFGRKEQ